MVTRLAFLIIFQGHASDESSLKAEVGSDAALDKQLCHGLALGQSAGEEELSSLPSSATVI